MRISMPLNAHITVVGNCRIFEASSHVSSENNIYLSNLTHLMLMQFILYYITVTLLYFSVEIWWDI